MAEFALFLFGYIFNVGVRFTFLFITEPVAYQLYVLQFSFTRLGERGEEFVADIDKESDFFFIFL